MNLLNKKKQAKLAISVFCSLLTLGPAAWAESDMEIQEKALKARELRHQGAMDHADHDQGSETAGKFRGVFYGYLPCHEEDCGGVKMTLSLNAKNNYLLVIQPAKSRNRESYEKGKYEWSENQSMVMLNPNTDSPQCRLAIKDSSTLLYISNDGAHMTGDQERYLMKRTDVANNRDMHIH